MKSSAAFFLSFSGVAGGFSASCVSLDVLGLPPVLLLLLAYRRRAGDGLEPRVIVAPWNWQLRQRPPCRSRDESKRRDDNDEGFHIFSATARCSLAAYKPTES